MCACVCVCVRTCACVHGCPIPTGAWWRGRARSDAAGLCLPCLLMTATAGLALCSLLLHFLLLPGGARPGWIPREARRGWRAGRRSPSGRAEYCRSRTAGAWHGLCRARGPPFCPARPEAPAPAYGVTWALPAPDGRERSQGTRRAPCILTR